MLPDIRYSFVDHLVKHEALLYYISIIIDRIIKDKNLIKILILIVPFPFYRVP